MKKTVLVFEPRDAQRSAIESLAAEQLHAHLHAFANKHTLEAVLREKLRAHVMALSIAGRESQDRALYLLPRLYPRTRAADFIFIIPDGLDVQKVSRTASLYQIKQAHWLPMTASAQEVINEINRYL